MLRRATTTALHARPPTAGGGPPSTGIPRAPIDAAAHALGRRRGRVAITAHPTTASAGSGHSLSAPVLLLWKVGGGGPAHHLQLQQARAMSTHARIQLREIRAWRRAQQAQQAQTKKNGKKGPLVLPRLRKAALNGIPLIATEAMDSPAPPSWETLKIVALQRAVPFMGFGFMDNAIMILAGDYIETGIGVTLGISTMAAAALGVLVADVLGLSVGELIERVAVKMGVPEARLTKSQTEMWITRATAMAGGSVGIAVGCVLGMLPLLFIDGKKGDREESPREICTTLARAATALLHAERVVVYAVERGEGREVKEAFASDGEPRAADTDADAFLMRRVVLPILTEREAVSFFSSSSSSSLDTQTTTKRQQQRPQKQPHSALGWPVFDREGKLMAVAVAVDHYQVDAEGEDEEDAGDDDEGRQDASAQFGDGRRGVVGVGVGGRRYAAFGAGEERMMVNVCSQLSEALENLYRRPEDHNSFEQNLEATAAHAAVPLRAVVGAGV